MTRRLQFRSSGISGDDDRQSSASAGEIRAANSGSINLLDFANLMLRKRLLIGLIVTATMSLTAIYIFLSPNRYRSVATILPSGQPDRLSAMKELAGLASLGGNVEENSSLLFPVILRSDQVKDALTNKRFTYSDKEETGSTTLSEYLGQDNPDYLKKSIDAITDISTDKKTGVISVSIETKYPELSQQILTQTLAELENFNLYKRKSQASSREKYLARELITRDQELREAESKLEEFQSSNRDWYGSSDPEILRTLADLQRDIEIKSRTYTFLKEQYEIARLDVQKDIPVVGILDPPSLPTIKSGPFRIRDVMLSGIVSFLIAVLLVALQDFIWRTRHQADSESLREFRQNLDSAFPIVNRLKLGRVFDRMEETVSENVPAGTEQKSQ